MRAPKILASAKGKNCTFRIPGICNLDPSTTVFCHAPDRTRGKGMKTSDHWGAYGCSSCHAAMDERRIAGTEKIWLEAIRETQEQLVKAGLIVLPAVAVRPKKMTKAPVPQQGGIRYRGVE